MEVKSSKIGGIYFCHSIQHICKNAGQDYVMHHSCVLSLSLKGPESGECESDPEQQRVTAFNRRQQQQLPPEPEGEQQQPSRPRIRPPRIVPPPPSPPTPTPPVRPPTPKTELIQSPEVSPIESDEEDDDEEAATPAFPNPLGDLRCESVSPLPLIDEEPQADADAAGVIDGKKKKKKAKKDKKEKKNRKKIKKKERRQSLAALQQHQQQQALQEDQEVRVEAIGSPLSSDPDFRNRHPVNDISPPPVADNRYGSRYETNGAVPTFMSATLRRPIAPRTPPDPPPRSAGPQTPPTPPPRTRQPPRTPPEPPMMAESRSGPKTPPMMNNDAGGGESPGTPVYHESSAGGAKRQPQTPPEPYSSYSPPRRGPHSPPPPPRAGKNN
jgi:hypothetical protein